MSLQLNFAAQLIRTKIRKGISKHSEVVGELKPGTYLSMPPPPSLRTHTTRPFVC